MSQIDNVKSYVLGNRGVHTAISVQNVLGGTYSLETIRTAFEQLKDTPSSGVESTSKSRIWSPGRRAR
ncbi:MAG TPA: hypothetical protein VLG36_04425 [Candidatus Chromulinivoraceae bacterium]|nr:hypothetical protein [Candidatus Chromulinivoraceae bacterium]